MNKLYLIIPAVLTLAFTGIYYVHAIDSKEKAIAKELATEQAAAAQIAEKAAAERQAREDADRRTAERLAEEKKREDDRRAKWVAAGQAILDDTATYTAQAEKNATELKALEERLTALRAEKDKAIQTAFDFDLEIEKARIAKRSAELEIQRLVEMTARRAGTSLGSVTATP